MLDCRESARMFTYNVLDERIRQVRKWGDQHRPLGMGPDVTIALCGAMAKLAQQVKWQNEQAVIDGNLTWLGVLLEEVLELFEADTPEHQITEAVQVAAVCGAIVRDLQR